MVADRQDQDRLYSLLAERPWSTLVTLKSDGRPQLSNVLHAFDPVGRTVRVSVTEDRAKTRNLRRDPRVSLHVSTPDGWGYAVFEGVAELSPVAADPQDATVEALVRLYRDLQGEHSDWDEYRAAMVADRRVLLSFTVDHAYGAVRG
ncbi:PPOX class F420-dependent oxidoreductase [Streptomyces sp. NPDC059740]|uniref:PPOX class F420-dependent oxidoreductase n=1 Tax=Streptomyces sp. NPDC059740 TaxID=3346926 RepID=UPI0036487491